MSGAIVDDTRSLDKVLTSIAERHLIPQVRPPTRIYARCYSGVAKLSFSDLVVGHEVCRRL